MESFLINKKFLERSDAEFATIVALLSGASVQNIVSGHTKAVSPTTLAVDLIGKYPEASLVRTLKMGITGLEDTGIFEKCDRILYLARCSSLKCSSGEHYIKMSRNEVKKIMESDVTVNKCSLLHFFGSLIGTFDAKLNIGYMGMDVIIRTSNKSRNTGYSYVDILKDIGVIDYIKQKGYRRTKDGLIYHPNTIYYRPEDKETAFQYHLDKMKDSCELEKDYE